MLTAELVNARRRGSELVVNKLGDRRAEALRIARELVALFREHVGAARDDLDAAIGGVEVGPRDQKLRDGLSKLLDDRATWSAASELDSEKARREVFLRATSVRRALSQGARFDRALVLADAAVALGSDPETVERALFADLKGASVLASVEPISPDALVDLYERSQAQAVLLRAVRIRVAVRCASPASARALFRRIKFLGLLHTIAERDDGYEIVIDGPLSLFESITKYGQKMALVLPVLEQCETWSLHADVRWGKERIPLTFRAEGKGAPAVDDPPMPDELANLVRGCSALSSEWRVAPCRVVLDLPGAGLLVPDLVFSRKHTKVYFEALGFWSRDAVFRRVELVEKGLREKVLFAVSSRLRVSEELLDDGASSALYVYKGTMSPRAVLERIERLSGP